MQRRRFRAAQASANGIARGSEAGISAPVLPKYFHIHRQVTCTSNSICNADTVWDLHNVHLDSH